MFVEEVLFFFFGLPFLPVKSPYAKEIAVAQQKIGGGGMGGVTSAKEFQIKNPTSKISKKKKMLKVTLSWHLLASSVKTALICQSCRGVQACTYVMLKFELLSIGGVL